VETIQLEQEIHTRYQSVLERVKAAAGRAGRSPADVRVVVVTKTHPVELVRAVLQVGALHLGENYAEEAISKKLALDSPDGIAWHMIGHVQSRKAAMVAEHFDWVHSLDSLKLAQRLDRFAGERPSRLPVLLECNVSGEESKFGWPAWQEADWDILLEPFAQILELPALEVRGLMTMAPFLPDPEQARPYFQRLKRLHNYLAGRLPEADWSELSMGMSADYEVAIEEGATWVRIGTAITGSRS
jgi:pyridoxal phosphate enzyme (YggS family)